MADKVVLVKFASWNCRGLNGTLKRNKIMTHVNSLGADIMFLQETHLKITRIILTYIKTGLVIYITQALIVNQGE